MGSIDGVAKNVASVCLRERSWGKFFFIFNELGLWLLVGSLYQEINFQLGYVRLQVWNLHENNEIIN